MNSAKYCTTRKRGAYRKLTTDLQRSYLLWRYALVCSTPLVVPQQGHSEATTYTKNLVRLRYCGNCPFSPATYLLVILLTNHTDVSAMFLRQAVVTAE